MEHLSSVIDTQHDLACANRILFSEGVLDAFGHVSVRHPDLPERFLISRNRAPALVEPVDICTVDFDGRASDGDARPQYLERFIHAAIYRTDPAVNAVVHSHAASVLPFTVSRQSRLRPVCHMAGFLGGGVPLFEIRDHAGDASDLLIRNPSLGTALALCRGRAPVVLMRGHGLTVSGSTLKEAVFRAIYTEKGARIQLDAERLGPCEYLTEGEAASADAAAQGQIGRAWDFWCWQLEQRGLALPTNGPAESKHANCR